MENIQKVINLNGFIRELKQNYHLDNLYTYTDIIYDSYPKWYKIHELDYINRYIQIFVLGDKYRFFYEHRGSGDCKYYDYNTIDQLRKKVYSVI